MKNILLGIAISFLFLSSNVLAQEVLWWISGIRLSASAPVHRPGTDLIYIFKQQRSGGTLHAFWEIWDYKTGEKQGSIQSPQWTARKAVISKNGKYMAATEAGYYSSDIYFYDLEAGEFIDKIEAENDGEMFIYIADFAFIGNSSNLAAYVYNWPKIQIFKAPAASADYSLAIDEGKVDSFEFSEDASTAVIQYENKNVDFVETETGMKINSMNFDYEGYICDVSSDGERVLAIVTDSLNDNDLCLFDCQSGDIIASWEKGISRSLLSPDGKYILAQENSYSRLTVFRTDAPGFERNFNNFLLSDQLSFIEGSSEIVAIGKRADINILNYANGDLVNRVGEINENVQLTGGEEVIFSPDGNFLVSGTNNGIIKVWIAETGELYKMFDLSSSYITGIDFKDNGNKMAVTSAKGDVYVFNVVNNFELILEQTDNYSYIEDVKFLPSKFYDLTTPCCDFEEYFFCSWHGGIYNLPCGGGDAGRMDTTWKMIQTLDISPDGMTIVAGSKDKHARVYKYKESIFGNKHEFDSEFRVSYTTNEGHLGVVEVDYSPDGSEVLIGTGGDMAFRIYDAQNFNLQREYYLNTQPAGISTGTPHCCRYFDDGRKFLTGDFAGGIRLWDKESGQVVYATDIMKQHMAANGSGTDKAVNKIAVSPNGRYIAAIDDFGDVVVFDFEDMLTDVETNDIELTEVKVYPQPSSDFLNIRLYSQMNVNAEVAIHDNLGCLVQKSSKWLANGTNIISLNTMDLPCGSYMYSIQTGNKILQGKFIVSR